MIILPMMTVRPRVDGNKPMPIPEWYHPIPDADPDQFTQAVDWQLSLAQRAYDPLGTFARQGEADWTIHASQDTREVKSLPAIYQSERTSVTVNAFTDDESVTQVSLAVGAEDDTSSDIYHAHKEEELPIIVALLGRIANVELAEMETHPRRVVKALAEAPGASIGFERNFAQKTLELPDAPGDAINATYFKMTGSIGVCEVRLARQVALPEGTFLYQQNIIRDSRDPDKLYCWPRAFMLGRHLAMGESYAEARIKGPELRNKPRANVMGKSDFETRLRQAGNAVIGITEMADVMRLASEPLSPDYRLRV
jgi:hypothetical protein